MTGPTPYAVVAGRVAGLLADVDEATAERVVPACPSWTVRQTLAHLVGVTADLAAGNLARAGRDDWTAAQVAARQDRSVAELLAEWETTLPTVAPMLAGPVGGQPTFDALTHELDLRSALHLPLEADPAALRVALDWLVPRFGGAVERREAPALLVVADDLEAAWRCGAGEPQTTLRGSGVDVLRSASGRRTRDQVAALLDGDVEPWWPAFRWGPFSPPSEPVD